MYEELIKALRLAADKQRFGNYPTITVSVETAYELAAAIETLIAQLAALQSENEELLTQHRTEHCEAAGYDCEELGVLRAALSRVEAERDASVHLLNDVWEMLDPDGPEGGYGEAAINMVAYLIYDKVRDYRHRFGAQGEG